MNVLVLDPVLEPCKLAKLQLWAWFIGLWRGPRRLGAARCVSQLVYC